MAEQGEDIVTVIDRLLDYVESNEFVTLKSASEALALNRMQVEKLALLLEENDLMEVHYTLSGVRLAKKERVPQEESGEAVKHVDNILAETQALSRQVMTSEHLTEFMEKDLLRRFKIAEKLLEDLEKTTAYTPQELAFVRGEVDRIEHQLAAFQTELNRLDKREDVFKARLDRFRDRLKHTHVKKGAEAPGVLARVSRFLGFVKRPKAEPKKPPVKIKPGKQLVERKPKKRGGLLSRFFNRGKTSAGAKPKAGKAVSRKRGKRK